MTDNFNMQNGALKEYPPGKYGYADEYNKQGIVLNPRDFWEVFIKRLWLMVLVGVIVAVGTNYRDKRNFVPRYASYATIYMMAQNTDTLSFAFGLSNSLMSDCQYCLQSQTTANAAYELLKDSGITLGEIAGAISADNPEGTRYITVSAKGATPEKAQLILNAVCRVTSEKMRDTTRTTANPDGYELTQIESEAGLGVQYNSLNSFDGVRLGIIAAIAVYMVFLVFRLFDDRLRDEEDIEKTIGVTVLGTVPDADISTNREKKRKRYYSSYGYGNYGYGNTYAARQAKPEANAVPGKMANAGVPLRKRNGGKPEK